MPALIIKTNADLTGTDRPTLLQTASENVAAMLGKPERYVMVILEQNPDMCFGGDTAPLAYLELKGVDRGDVKNQLTPSLSFVHQPSLGTETGVAGSGQAEECLEEVLHRLDPRRLKGGTP